MQEPCAEVLELYSLLDKLNTEANKTIETIQFIKKKGTEYVIKADAVVGSEPKKKIIKTTREYLKQLCSRVSEINEDLELDASDDESANIPHMPVGQNIVQLKFMSGQSPWDFWLLDDKIDKVALHKLLLKKHQNNILDPYLNPKPQDSVCFLERNKVFRGVVVQLVNADKIKIQDCDSNSCRLVGREKVFRADPDACDTHASALHCTISKNVQEHLWDSDLQSLFTDVLKEAVLSVQILEKLPTEFPSFVVNIDIEDDGNRANFNSWIIDRLLTEVQKLKTDNSDSVYEFLSAEVTDPYHNANEDSKVEVEKTINCEEAISDFKIKQTCNSEEAVPDLKIKKTINCEKAVMGLKIKKPKNSEEAVSSTNDSEFINNLNSAGGKDSNDVIPNIELNESHRSLTPESNDMNNTNVTTSNIVVPSPSSSLRDSFSCNQDPSRSNSLSSVTDSVKSFESLPSSCNETRAEIVPRFVQQRPVVPIEHMTYMTHSPASTHYYLPPHRPPFPQYVPPYPPYGPPPPYAYQPQAYQGPSIRYQPSPQYYHPQSPPRVTTYHRPSQDKLQITQNSSLPPSLLGTKPKQDSDSSSSSSNVSVEAKEFIPQQLKQSTESISSQPEEGDRCSPPPDPDGTYHFDLKNQTTLLKPNQNLEVVVSHIISPAKFYVNFSNENYKLLNNMQGDMLIYYSKRQPVGYTTWQQAKKSLGKFCVAKWSFNDHYYRVEIVDWAIGDNQVRVFFVDYGRTVDVPLRCLQPLSKHFSKLSMTAQRCHLAKVRPPNGLKEWPKECIDTFKLNVKEGIVDKYSITVVPAAKEELSANSLAVRLYRESKTELAQSINNEMISYSQFLSQTRPAGLPNRPQVLPSSSSGSSEVDVYSSIDISSSSENSRPLLSPELLPKLQDLNHHYETSRHGLDLRYGKSKDDDFHMFDSWQPMSEDFFGSRNNPRLDTDDPGVALTGYKAMDELRICKFGESCRKANCNKEHVQPNPDGVTSDKELVITKAEVINLPDVGDVLQVRVSAVDDVDLFYVQLQESRGIALNDEDRQTLSQLMNSMNLPENVRKMKHLQSCPALGQLVLAFQDHRWFRARVINIDDNDISDVSFEVCFIDYGSTASLKIEDLREMEPKYTHLPIQSIECSLANIQSPTNEDLRTQATEMLEQTILGRSCTARVYDREVSNGECTRLQLVLQTSDGTDVGDYLVDKKLCHSSPAIFFENSILKETPILL